MAKTKNAEKARRRTLPFVIKALGLCVLAFIVLLVVLPAPPEIESGGVTQVARHVPKLRDTVDPITNNAPPVISNFPRVAGPTVVPVVPPAPTQPAVPIAPPVSVAVPGPEPRTRGITPVLPGAPAQLPEPDAVAPAAPVPSPEPEVVTPAAPAPPNPVRKPQEATEPDSTQPAAQDEPKRQLPWRIPGETAALPPESAPAPQSSSGGALPSASAINSWVKSQAWEFLGGVDTQGNILYRFEVWLEAPSGALKNVKSVAYEYDAPSATPKVRESDRAEGGFRARFGSLACAKEITITLTMADGQKQRTKVDGCQVLN